MIFIVARFRVRPEHLDAWLERAKGFSEATRAEPGNLWFEWSRSVEDPAEFVLVEAFSEDGAGPHVNSDHFKAAIAQMPQALVRTPKIVSRQVSGDGWDVMGEVTVD
jgi:quinol monooxygenase YgiN